MRKNREVDVTIAEHVFGYDVFVKNEMLFELTEGGERPLRFYTKDMNWAWEVAEKLKISLVPIEGNQWFAFAASNNGWTSPEGFLEFLKIGDFELCGAAVSENPAEAICNAAAVAIQKQQLQTLSGFIPSVPENPSIN